MPLEETFSTFLTLFLLFHRWYLHKSIYIKSISKTWSRSVSLITVLAKIWGQTYRLLLVTLIMSFLDFKSKIGFCRGMRLCRISPNGTEMFSVGFSNITQLNFGYWEGTGLRKCKMQPQKHKDWLVGVRARTCERKQGKFTSTVEAWNGWQQHPAESLTDGAQGAKPNPSEGTQLSCQQGVSPKWMRPPKWLGHCRITIFGKGERSFEASR